MNKLHINILTFCDDVENIERFNIMKKALPSISKLKSDNVFISLWDNGSSEVVKDYIKSLDFIDYMYFSEDNLYDVPSLRALPKAAELTDSNYVCHMEDDLEVISENCIDSILEFIEGDGEVAGVRLTKFDIYDIARYDKERQNKNTDKSNMMSIKNLVSNKDLSWFGPANINGYEMFKCNWHWYNFPIIAEREILAQIIPDGDVEPLQVQENKMRKNFHKLNKKLGILNGGVVTHLGTFDNAGSMRLFVRDNKIEHSDVGIVFPVLKDAEINLAVDKFLNGLKKCLNLD